MSKSTERQRISWQVSDGMRLAILEAAEAYRLSESDLGRLLLQFALSRLPDALSDNSRAVRKRG
jgi:hypothetical protein